MNPPRALWVPYDLGRPLGVPNDPVFQRNVLRAALNLLPTLTEHTIVDYPVEAPEASYSDTWACPVSFDTDESESRSARLQGESQRLATWWRETYRSRGRTLVGAAAPLPEDNDSEQSVPQRVDTLIAVLSAVAEGASLDTVPQIADAARSVSSESTNDIEWSHPMPFLLRHIVQDLRCYYQEAIASQPGQPSSPSHHALNDWIFHETALGETIIEVGRRLTEAEDPRLRILRGWTIPEGYWPDGNTWGTSADPTVTPSRTDRLSIADEADKLFSGR